MDQGLYGFPKRRQQRPLSRRFTRYFDALQFGSPLLWWAVDSPILATSNQYVGLYDKSGANRSVVGPSFTFESTLYGPALYVYNRMYTLSNNPITGNNPRTLFLVFVPNMTTSGATARPLWRNGNFFINHTSAGFRIQNVDSPGNSGVMLTIGHIGNLNVLGIRYTGTVLSAYVNGSFVASNTVSVNTSSGSCGLVSYQAGMYTQYSEFWFYECVLYGIDIGDSETQRASNLLYKQYMSML